MIIIQRVYLEWEQEPGIRPYPSISKSNTWGDPSKASLYGNWPYLCVKCV